MDDEIVENLYGRYFNDIYGYFTTIFNMLTSCNSYDKLIDEFSINDMDFEEWCARSSFIQKIDIRIHRLEEDFEELIKLSKDEKFTTMLDTLIETYTNYLLTSKGDE